MVQFITDSLPRVAANGIFFMSDPHVATMPPFTRAPGYTEHVLRKVRAGLEQAARTNMVPVFLGDFFHWPGELSEDVVNGVIDVFTAYSGTHVPWLLLGNHDVNRLDEMGSSPLLNMETSGLVRLIRSTGPQFLLSVVSGKDEYTLVFGASPSGSEIPQEYVNKGAETVIWGTHHGVNFPDFPNRPVKMYEIPGVDWVVNGHIHRPQPTQLLGGTRWVNPGGLVRMKNGEYARTRRPAAVVWTPSCDLTGELKRWEVPFLPFSEVFL